MLPPRDLFPCSALAQRVRQSVLAVVAACAAASATGQGLNYGALEELFGEPVTTSVTGGPQRASAVPASTAIITAAQIRRSGALDVPGVLKQVTGVDVLQWSASHTDVAVRGYNKAFSSRLLVLVNGREIYADHYGYTPWAALPVELGEIRQIEVVKGPNSALFGFNAVGGVINIITFDADDDDVSFISGTAATQDHLQLSAVRSLRLGEKAALRVSAGARESEDFDTPQRLNDRGARGGDERHALAFDLHYQLRSNVELELEGSRVLAKQSAMSPSYSMAYEQMETRSLRGNVRVDSGRAGLTEATLYRNWIDNRVFLPLFDGREFVPSTAPIATFNNEVSVAELQHLFKPASAHTVRVGVEHRDSQLPTVPLNQAVVSYQVLAWSGMWEWQFLPSLTFTLAVREDHLELDRDGSIPAGLGLSNADWQRHIDASSYNAAIVWQPGERDTVRLNAGRGNQLPSLYNLGGSLFEFPVPPEFQPPASIFTTGLPTLQPTKVNQQELSWEHQLQLLPLRTTLTYFQGDSSRLIADAGGSDIAAGIFGAPANIGDSETDGVELSLLGNIGAAWRWQLGYLYQDVDDQLLPQYPTAFSLVDYANTTPRHMVNARLHWAQGPWEVDLYARYKGRFAGLHADETYLFDPFTLPQVLVPLSDYTTVDLHVGRRLGEQLRVELAGHNLLHSEQTQTSGSRVERRLFATLRYDF